MRLRFLDPAEEEMYNTARFYETRTLGLGVEFLDEIEYATATIIEYPQVGPIIHSEIRRLLTRQFPYALLYRIDGDEILVLAVMHQRRRPDYWKNHLRK